MRVRIIFGLRNRGAALPFYHQYLFSDLVETLLEDYVSARALENTKLLYNFSGLKGQTRISRKGLHYCSRRVTLVFSTIERELGNHLLRKIFSQPLWQVGELELEPESVEEEVMPEFSEMMKYVCISPLVIAGFNVYRDLKEFILPTTDKFSDLLYESTMTRMEGSGYFTPAQIAEFYRFQVVPDRRYLDRVQQSDKKFARIYSVSDEGKQAEVRGYTFPFVLYAAPEVQRFIFFSGLGEFTQQGFGMLDLAHSDPTQRTIEYRDYIETSVQ
jgi:CRISPR-associated endoribonuclease Cas6